MVDGVPVSSRITGTGFNSHLSADSPVDYGSSLSDINPDDIEKVTVLKGPGATALYGSRAAGGAIIITTKSGVRQDRGLGVTVNSNFSVEQINRYPDYQFEYGEGRSSAYFSYLDSEDGPNTATTVAAGRAWGPKFDGQMYYQYNPDAPDGRPTVRTPMGCQQRLHFRVFPDRNNILKQRFNRRRGRKWLCALVIDAFEKQMDYPKYRF